VISDFMPSRGNPLLSVRIPPELDEAINAYAIKHQKSRSEVAIAALQSLVIPSEPQDEMAQIKSQVAALQEAIAHIGK
jgi:predicted transcriptional regulator